MDINNNELVCISKFNQIGVDDRGITCDFTLPRAQSDFIFLTRKSGSIAGNTYHEGNRAATNPKLFIFIAGKVKLTYRKAKHDKVFETIISQRCIIRVNPFVIHKFEVIEDAVFLECNSIEDIQKDRIRENV